MSEAHDPHQVWTEHGDGEESQSVCSSVEAPPFAMEERDSHVRNELAIWETKSQNSDTIPQPTTITIHAQPANMAGSRAWSSITTAKEESMMQSSANSAGMVTIQEHVPATPSDRQSDLTSQRNDLDIPIEHVQDLSGCESMLTSSAPLLDQSIGHSSHLPDSSIWMHASSSRPKTGPALNFSSLMREADDRHGATIVPARMPMLSEDDSLAESNGKYRSPFSSKTASSSCSTPRTTNRSQPRNWFHAWLFGSPARSYSAVPVTALSPSYLDERVALDSAGRGIRATNMGGTTFQVAMTLESPCITARDVMDVLGNPDMLRLWCDPVRALVITNSSEGSRSAIHRRDDENDRQYEGEWVEGTTSVLVSPNARNNCLFSIGRTLWTCLGFPAYGRITMFIERSRGQIGLTIGPFSGGFSAFHTIQVEQVPGGVALVDKVRLDRDEDFSSYSWCGCCCGLCDGGCCRPPLAGHVDQALSSMMRLRVLVEHGEAVVGSGSVDLEMNEAGSVSTAPLLA